MRHFCLALTIAAGILAPLAARADVLTVATREYGPWPAAVAALQADVGAQGRVIHVTVQDDAGRRVPCGEYTLSLDAVAARAFAPGQCSPADGATALALRQRAELFAHDDAVPRPLQAGVTAVQLRHGSAVGGAASEGGSEVTCSLAVRPFVRDLEHGTTVYLEPGRYAMRVLSAGASAQRDGDGWTLRGEAQGAAVVDYAVVDTLNGATVVSDRATLQCAATPLAPIQTEPPAASPTFAPPTLLPGVTVTGPTAVTDQIGTTCGDAPSVATGMALMGTTRGGRVQPMYQLALDARVGLSLEIDSDFGGSVVIFDGCPRRGTPIAYSSVFGGGFGQRLRWSVGRGTYYVVIVDADVHPHRGHYVVHTELMTDYLSGL